MSEHKRYYSVNQRIRGGSMDPRLNMDCVDRRLNAKLKPTWPTPLVRATSDGNAVPEPAGNRRSSEKNKLPGRFFGEKDNGLG